MIRSIISFLVGCWKNLNRDPLHPITMSGNGGWSTVLQYAIPVIASMAGSLISGNATSKAQDSANATNESLANAANQQAWNQYLLSRGTSPGMNGVPAGDVNTQLPLWATINGAPAEQSLFNSIISAGGLNAKSPIDLTDPNAFASLDQTKAFIEANPDVAKELQSYLDGIGDTRSVAQWLYDDIAEGDPNFTNQLKNFSKAQNDQLAADAASRSALPSNYQSLIDSALGTVGGIYDGSLLGEEMGALQPVLDARSQLGDLYQVRNDEQRTKLGDVLNTQLSGLDEILGARTGAAQSIYDANLLKADTYGESALEAVNRVMAQQQAKNALRGYTGGSSMDDLVKARTMAPALQEGAGARAQAGVDYQTLLGQARESDALGRYDVRSTNAQSLAQILDADAAMQKTNAEIQNAMDRMGLVTNDVSRRVGNVGVPGQMYQNQVALNNLTYDQNFQDLDAVLKRLSALNTGGAVQTPTYTTPTITPVLNSGQIAGSAITSGVQTGMDYYSTQQLINALNKSNATSTTNTTTQPKSTTTSSSIWDVYDV